MWVMGKLKENKLMRFLNGNRVGNRKQVRNLSDNIST